MKWNWGTKIMISFLLFGVFIMYMVVQAFREDFDLVSENYYQDELAYQERIIERSNLYKSGEEIAISLQNRDVLFIYPETFTGAEGTIYFYHTSRKLLDKTFVLDLDTENQQRIATDQLVKGNYKVKISWEVNGLTYFQEKELYLK